MKADVIRVSYSGGMDSTALAIYLKEQGEDIELVMSDTGAELPETLWFAPYAAKQLGAKLTVVQSKSFFQRLVHWGFLLPSFRVRWCTRELKTDALPNNLAIGICADEDRRMPNAHCRPLVDAGITKAEARRLCEKHELVNPVYTWRSSCSCFCCPFQHVQDWKNLWREHPDLFKLAEQWEEISISTSPAGFTWNNGFKLSDIRMADEQQMKLFPECRETACVICSI